MIQNRYHLRCVISQHISRPRNVHQIIILSDENHEYFLIQLQLISEEKKIILIEYVFLLHITCSVLALCMQIR